MNLAGIRVYKEGNTIFIPLPPELWRSCNGCSCQYCTSDSNEINRAAYWDTLVVSSEYANDYSWVVHAPEYHGVKPKR
jgi:hypothetical protein